MFTATHSYASASTRLHALAHFAQVKGPKYALHSKLCEPRCRHGRFGKNKNLLHLSGIKPPNLSQPTRSQATGSKKVKTSLCDIFYDKFVYQQTVESTISI